MSVNLQILVEHHTPTESSDEKQGDHAGCQLNSTSDSVQKIDWTQPLPLTPSSVPVELLQKELVKSPSYLCLWMSFRADDWGWNVQCELLAFQITEEEDEKIMFIFFATVIGLCVCRWRAKNYSRQSKFITSFPELYCMVFCLFVFERLLKILKKPAVSLIHYSTKCKICVWLQYFVKQITSPLLIFFPCTCCLCSNLTR